MLAKIVFLFLAFIAVLGIFGRLKVPGGARLASLKRKTLDAKKCPDCGRYQIGQGPCDCRKGKR
ncbi:hypothetical protein [Tropicibacter naphthalenivorans]|uniref:Uncharacterized protein n=1 Tax=Tropicibacter naphthalenivorans TaxID=441103 RepID=A0A0P1G0U4_9RHOB|nr:hypothetical protein [Tropicibacter naphthalenivorans]CUH75383.1 hypothetical protein TRN7648_00411 [Tropicibacter naphthalenivorans]SMC44716.1 hypothetical protein SAMN04488093_101468 [Tropicibacter naphthalenivorans]